MPPAHPANRDTPTETKDFLFWHLCLDKNDGQGTLDIYGSILSTSSCQEVASFSWASNQLRRVDVARRLGEVFGSVATKEEAIRIMRNVSSNPSLYLLRHDPSRSSGISV
jgi:hypothetical protein